jgi:Family of unknown function (DUF5719)
VIRARLALVVVLAIGVTVGGLALERSLGVRPAAVGTVSTPEALSGAWFCPHGGGEGWDLWVVAANPSDQPSRLVLTPHGATAEVSSATLGPRTHRYFRVSAEELAAGTVVEFFGGQVVASMVVVRPDGGGLAAEPCTSTAAGRWYVPDGTADVKGEGASVVVMNPTAADAVVDFVVTTEEELLRPGPLQGVVLGPGRVKGFDLNRFSLGARTIGARVTAVVGRVAVAGFGLSEGGIRAEIGVSQPSGRWFLPGTGDGGRGELVVGAPAAEVPFQARAQGSEQQAPALEQANVEAGAIRTFTVSTREGGLVVEAEGSGRFVVARRSSFGGAGVEEPEEAMPAGETPTPAPSPSPGASPVQTTEESPTPGESPTATPTPSPSPTAADDEPRSGRDRPDPTHTVDEASTAGSPVVAASWVVPPATGPEGGPASLIIQNAGTRAIRARVLLFGSSGVVEAPDLAQAEIPAGTVAVLDLAMVGEPVTALVTSAGGGVVAAQAALSADAYSVSLGSPGGSVLTDSAPGI